jgi:hypothetical protein
MMRTTILLLALGLLALPGTAGRSRPRGRNWCSSWGTPGTFTRWRSALTANGS